MKRKYAYVRWVLGTRLLPLIIEKNKSSFNYNVWIIEVNDFHTEQLYMNN